MKSMKSGKPAIPGVWWCGNVEERREQWTFESERMPEEWRTSLIYVHTYTYDICEYNSKY